MTPVRGASQGFLLSHIRLTNPWRVPWAGVSGTQILVRNSKGLEMNEHNRCLSRRDLLCRGGMGIGGLALSGVTQDALGSDAPSALNVESPLTPREPHFPATAKRVRIR